MTNFAAQAVIAIENARLLKELRQRTDDLFESLEQQPATSDILRVISGSPTDVRPIFDAIVRSASRLCGGEYAIVTRYDGELLHLAAQHNARPGTADTKANFFPQAPMIATRALVDAAVVHVPDIEIEKLEPSVREFYRRIRLRAAVAVPMIYEGHPIGVVGVSRGTAGPFSDRQIDLLRTFADQAVIAIENVRLFTELQASNRELSQALDQHVPNTVAASVIGKNHTSGPFLPPLWMRSELQRSLPPLGHGRGASQLRSQRKHPVRVERGCRSLPSTVVGEATSPRRP